MQVLRIPTKDYKIAAKAIASRLSKVLPKIINDDQTGYIQGRYIGQNIRLIQDIMKVTSPFSSISKKLLTRSIGTS